MTGYEKLYKGLGKAAWAYFFLYFNINLNTVSIRPSFIGYILFLSAISDLAEEERDLTLLRTPGIILAVWQFADWFLISFTGRKLDGTGLIPALDILIAVINLYFHFQLLTNLASIAHRHQENEHESDQKLLGYRTFQTVLLTVSIFVEYSSRWLSDYTAVILVGIMLLYIIVGILLMKALFDLRRHLKTNTETS